MWTGCNAYVAVPCPQFSRRPGRRVGICYLDQHPGALDHRHTAGLIDFLRSIWAVTKWRTSARFRLPYRQPPVTGGKNATSSPGPTRVAGSAKSWFTAQRTVRRLAKALAWPGLRSASQAMSSPTVRTRQAASRFPATCPCARAARRSKGWSVALRHRPWRFQRGVGTVSILPSECMIVLVPLPLGTTMAEPPPGGVMVW